MVVSQSRSRLKASGSRYKAFRKKRQFEAGNTPALTKIAAKKVAISRIMGGHAKQRLLQHDTANVLDQKSKKFQKAKIVQVSDNPANKHYVRRNIMTKGSIIVTELGKARITNRPGQEGQINAVLVEKK